jgi:hypothetical protein
VVEAFWGYVVFVIGMLILLALYVAAGVWWFRWVARRWWGQAERENRQKAKINNRT